MATAVGRDGEYLYNDFTRRKETQFGTSAPDWFRLKQGLNIEAACRNPNCQVYNKRFWAHCTDTDFDLIARIKRITCPMCGVIPSTDTVTSFGFYNCTYSFDGQKRRGNTNTFEDVRIAGTAYIKNGFVKYEGSNFPTLWKFIQVRVVLPQDPLIRVVTRVLSAIFG